jgi:hypothetical protein
MAALIVFLVNLVASLFKSKCRLEAENAALRQQLIVLQRKVRGRVQFTNSDRLFFIQQPDKLGRELRKSIQLSLRGAKLECNVLSLHIPKFTQSFPEFVLERFRVREPYAERAYFEQPWIVARAPRAATRRLCRRAA